MFFTILFLASAIGCGLVELNNYNAVMFVYNYRAATSCSYYVSVGSVSSYNTYYAIYTSCGWWGRRRCRAGLVINSVSHTNLHTVLDLIQYIIQHIMPLNGVVQVMDHFLIVHVSQL